MQTTSLGQDANRDLPFGKALAEYLRRRDAGEQVDRETFVATHSNVASKLREYFDAADEVTLLIGDDFLSSSMEDRRFPCRFGDFELLGEIARGGRGVVYRALQISLNRLVAVKMILQGHLAARADVERFWSEARAVARLQHPNIVAIYDVGEHDGQHFFSMELVNGQSLADVVREHPLAAKDAATYLVSIANAIQYAHDQKLLHRDLKPSNILVNSMDQVKVTDFGFAKQLQTAVTQTITGQVLGTPSYMPPEQALGESELLGPACDVYSMGAVLYELLTGRPPFRAESTLETLRQVVESEAPSPRSINPGVPRDLDTISLKCLAKEPSRRYGSARELADDLSRYLHDKPIFARPPSISGRVWRWSRRNRGWTAAILLATTALLTVGAGGVIVSNAISVSRGRESLLQLQSIERRSGWSERMWDVTASASVAGKDRIVQSHAALALDGVDARLRRRFEGFGTEQVAWNSDGTRLLMNTITNAVPKIRNVRIWNVKTDELSILPSQRTGPIWFSQQDRPMQLSIDAAGASLVQHDLEGDRSLGKFELPTDWIVLADRVAVISADGECVAAVVRDPQGVIHFAVWKDVKSQPRFIDAESDAAQVLALSNDGSLLAVTQRTGQVSIYNVESGQQVALFRVGRRIVHTVVFSRDPHQVIDTKSSEPSFDWIVAIGYAGGQIAVWDLETQSPQSFLRGSLHDVYQVAFSPDGMTLASAGRGKSRIWDVTTGRQLLEIDSNDFAQALAFSPDGNRLAIGTRSEFSVGDAEVWDLEFGRGIQSLRGLSGPVSKIAFSPDGSTICALSHDWRAGIWDLKHGTLRTTLDLPSGLVADNAAIALNENGSQLAYCSGTSAVLVDVASRKIVEQWELPFGLVDFLVRTSPEQLILIRAERDGNNRSHIRLRNLLGKTPAAPFASIYDFSRHVFCAVVGPKGPYLIVDGLGGPDGSLRLLRVYDLQGKLVTSIPTASTRDFSTMSIDEAGVLATSLVATPAPVDQIAMFELPSSEVKQQFSLGPLCLSAAAKLYATSGGDVHPEQGISLFRLGSDTRLITFDVAVGQPFVAAFGRQGKLLAWGRQDGTVCVANLSEVNRRLDKLGLAW